MSKNFSERNDNFIDKRNKLGLGNSNVRNKGRGIVEDDTEYGEFIASFDAWLTPEEQKKRAKYLENLGDRKD